MSNVRRIYVEKKSEYAVNAKSLLNELRTYLGINGIENVRILNRYDIEGLSDVIRCPRRERFQSDPRADDLSYHDSLFFHERVRIFDV